MPNYEVSICYCSTVPIVKVKAYNRHIENQKHTQTGQKRYATDLSMRGIKKLQQKINSDRQVF